MSHDLIHSDSFYGEAVDAISSKEITVVSFDFFDTLSKRFSINPIKFFYYIGRLCADRRLTRPEISPAQFSMLRVEAERRARRYQKEKDGRDEITLLQIWDELVSVLRSGVSPVDGANLEFKAEVSKVFGNNFAFTILEYAISLGKKIIIVSDTYYSSSQIRNILNKILKKDYTEEINIYVSSEYFEGKGGRLFDVVVAQLGVDAKSILHIGDNYHVDVEVPRTLGVQTAFVPNGTDELWRIIELETKYGGIHLSPDSYNGKINLWGGLASLRAISCGAVQGARAFSYHLYGAIVLGPLISGYIQWVENLIGAYNEDVLVCGLLREGGFIVDLLRKRNPELAVTKLGVSRLALASAALRSVTRETLRAVIPQRHPISLRQFVGRIGLTESDFPIAFADRNICTGELQFIEDLIRHILDRPSLVAKVYEYGSAYYARMSRHIVSKIRTGSEDRKLIFVDLGWAASIQEGIIKNFNFDTSDFTGLYFALNDSGLTRAASGLHVAGFLFDGSPSHSLAMAGLRCVEILEQACTPDHGSVIDYDASGNALFGREQISRTQLEQRKLIQNGIELFLDVEKNCLKNGRFEPDDWRACCQKIFLRAMLLPIAEEKRLFSEWVHDDSFADAKLDRLIPDIHARVSQYLSPSQVAEYGFDICYWPFAVNESRGAHIAYQAAFGQILSGDYSPFAYKASVTLSISGVTDRQLVKLFDRDVHVNQFGKSCVEFRFRSEIFDNLILNIESAEEKPWAIDFLIFRRLGFSGDGVDSSFIIEREVIGDYLTNITHAEPLRDGIVSPGVEALFVRIPNQVMEWSGQALVSFAIDQLITTIAKPSHIMPILTGAFDKLLGVQSPFTLGVAYSLETEGSLHSVGWAMDRRNMSGPDAASLILEGDKTITIPTRLYGRPDVSKHFGKIIRGMVGLSARISLYDLSLGVYRVTWRLVFGGVEIDYDLNYTIEISVGSDQKPFVMFYEITSQRS